MVQVKYEMLRRVSADGRSVADAASSFGVSRPTFYKAQTDFERDGLAVTGTLLAAVAAEGTSPRAGANVDVDFERAITSFTALDATRMPVLDPLHPLGIKSGAERPSSATRTGEQDGLRQRR